MKLINHENKQILRHQEVIEVINLESNEEKKEIHEDNKEIMNMRIIKKNIRKLTLRERHALMRLILKTIWMMILYLLK